MKFQQNDVALIVGGTSGLGRKTAELLLTLGLKVIIAGRCEKKGRIASEEIGASFCQVDVCDYQRVEDCFESALDGDLNLRIFVNCAGISPVKKLISRGLIHDPAVFAEAINTNLLGTLYCSTVAASIISKNEPVGSDQQKGVIINTSSVAAFEGQIGQVAYAASKGGVNAMTLPMARELASHGIRVCTIAPGLFDTPLVSSLDPKIKLAIQNQTPFPKRSGVANEFAFMVKHIVENTMLNGTVLRLDGGLRMSNI